LISLWQCHTLEKFNDEFDAIFYELFSSEIFVVDACMDGLQEGYAVPIGFSSQEPWEKLAAWHFCSK